MMVIGDKVSRVNSYNFDVLFAREETEHESVSILAKALGTKRPYLILSDFKLMSIYIKLIYQTLKKQC